MLMPSTLSLLRTVFTDREQRRLAIAIWASGFAAGAALGPIVGGLLLEHFHWGSVFLLAVPVLVPMLILVPLLIPESRDPAPGRIDLISTLLSLAAMGPVVYGIKSLATEGVAGSGIVRDRVRHRRGCLVRATPVAQQLADARRAALPSGLVRRRGAHQPVQRHRVRRIPLLRVAAPAADRRAHPGRRGHRPAARARRDDRRRARRRADRPARATPRARSGRARALGRGLRHRRVHDGRRFDRAGRHRVRAARSRHRRGRDRLERAHPLERPAEKAGAASAVSETAYELGAVLGTAPGRSSPRTIAPRSSCPPR